MTDRTMRHGWDIVCKRCGEPVIKHTVYFANIPADAIEGQFDSESGEISGFYCLKASTASTASTATDTDD